MITAWIMHHWKPLALALGVMIVAGGVVHLWHAHTEASLRKDAIKLKEENRALTDSYNQALGVAKANEQAAREEKMKADAIIATIEAKTMNVKKLDDQLEQVNANYETAKQQLGDCGATPDECSRKLCLELEAAGFKVKGGCH